jgi:hypothetical protein
MVLANGQYMFSCDGSGAFDLGVPLDVNGQITLFSFADGFAPYSASLGPNDFPFTVFMETAPPGSPLISMSREVACAANNWVRISGAIESFGGEPLCAMVLSNGQQMFTCGDSLGRYDLTVPVDENGHITMFGFADGFQPHTDTFVASDCAPTSAALEVVTRFILMMFGDTSLVAPSHSASSNLVAAGDSFTQPISLTLPCMGGGAISYDGTRTVEQVTNPLGLITTTSGSLEYANCLGASGFLAAWGRGEQYSADHATAQVRLDGTLDIDGCDVTYTALTTSVSGDPRDITTFISSPMITNGEIFVSCSEDRVLCRFNNVDLLDIAAVENSCAAVP